MSTRPFDHDVTTADWRSQILEVKQPPERVGAIYMRLAPVYELWARLTESGPRRRVLELAQVQDGESLLEVAVGTGAQLVDLARANPAAAWPASRSRTGWWPRPVGGWRAAAATASSCNAATPGSCRSRMRAST
jgi:hypothetical protein